MKLIGLKVLRTAGASSHLLMSFLAIMCVVGVPMASADYVYRMDANSNSSTTVLHEYNTATNTWTIRAPVLGTNLTQLASDGTNVFALPNNGNIYRYDRVADAWNFVQAGPAASQGNGPISMFEIHNGEFYWGKDGTNTLHYTVGGVWNSVSTPRIISSGSDIDTQNDQLYIRTYGELGGFVYDIASNTFPNIFDNNTNTGENSRVGGFYNGDFYSRTWFGNLISIDLNSNTAVDTGVPLATEHASMDISPAGLVYLNGYQSTETTFEVFDIITNSVTSLANAPAYGGNSHPSLAWVVGVPEPTTLTLLTLMVISAIGGVRRRRHS